MSIVEKSIVLIGGYSKKDELIKNGGIVFIASLIAGLFNYIYQVYMGRALGPEDYGTFGALFAIFYIIAIISQTLGTSTTRFVSKFIGEGKKVGFFIKIIGRHVVIIGFLFLILIISLRYQISDFLKLRDIGPVIVLGIILFLAWISPIFDGALRGLQKFSILGITGIANTFCKLIFGVLLVILGFGVNGALAGVIIGTGIGLIITMVAIRPYMVKNNPHDPEFNVREFYSYSMPVLLAMISLSVPGNIDVILVKYFFSPLEAGLYTSVSVLGKIIFFFPGAIGTVMFSMILSDKENSKKILKKSLFYVGAMSGSLALVYILIPGIVIKIFGDRYSEGVGLVGIYGMAMFLFALMSIMISYHLAIKDIRYVTGFVGFTIIEVALLTTFHSSLFEMVEILFMANIIFMIVSMIYTFRGVVRTA